MQALLLGGFTSDIAVVLVLALGSNVAESNQVEEVSDTLREDGNIAIDEEDISYHVVYSAGLKRRCMKAKPRIPTAVDTSRLNKHLTNIWSSKRKKTAVKKYPSSLQLESLQGVESEMEVSDHIDAALAADESTDVNAQASTVIIVKTLPQKVAESSNSTTPVPVEMNQVSEDKAKIQKGSRDIAERLKARKERMMTSLGGGRFDGSMSHSGQVTCELCAEVVDDYAQLVRHVCQQHEDCTYVRSYLDEIQPIADALTAVQLLCKECGRTFVGHVALAAHRHECGALSKLGAKRRRVAAGLLSPSQHSQHNGAAAKRSSQKPKPAVVAPQDRSKCTHCKRTFSSQDKLDKHVVRVHTEKDAKQRAGRGGGIHQARPKSTAAAKAKSSAVAVSPSEQQQADSSQLSASSGAAKFQRCDHCSACFSRTSLLITHMRYCLKADHNR